MPYTAPDAQTIVDNWVSLTSMPNDLNRVMGYPDAYLFVLTPQVIEKLSYLHRLVHRQWHLGDY
ncbi:MAG: putative zinc-binding metallopeptidase [Candidatus Devosia symbiotica]|nr:putative zinc-binding metallopeptidase [Candidatus Devosia symbiotica]